MAFNKGIPTASTSLRVSNPQILENQESSQEAINNEHIFTGTDAGTQTGDHTQGSARCFFKATAPDVRIDTTNFIATDNGSLWINTGDNALSIMTDYSQAIAADKWTLVSDEVIAVLLAANRVFAGTLGVDGDFEVGTGSEFTVAAATGNTVIAGTLDIVGNIDPTTYEKTNGGFIDDDTMLTASDTTVASSESVKAYIDTRGVNQIVNSSNGAVATGTTQMPFDDSIPQITEGNEYMTLAITPSSETSNLKIDVVFNYAHSVSDKAMTTALFQDTTTGALAAASMISDETTNYIDQISFTHYMAAGTTSETTFKVRAGIDASGTTTFNGEGGTRRHGGVMASSITITEYK